MRQLTRLALLITAVLLLAACGSDDGGDDAAGTTAAAAAGTNVIELSATEFAFSPPTVELEQPGEYTFRLVNDGGAPHALEIEGEGIEEAASETIAPGETTELTVELQGGEYEMYCPVDGHREQGMEGTVVVGGSAAGGGGATTGDDGTTTGDDGGTTTGDEDDSGGYYDY